MLIPKRQKLAIVTRNEYAVHFVKYDNKTNHRNGLDRTDEHSTRIHHNTSENGYTDYFSVRIDFQKDHLTLYPLLRKDVPIISDKEITEKQFFMKENECVIAATLYCLEDKLDVMDDYVISNPLFTKIHRFMILITGEEDPVIFISCKAEEYSILFTVKQGDYEAYFRYNDILYRV
ncbi:unnamed protein product [Mucor hiemalis]